MSKDINIIREIKVKTAKKPWQRLDLVIAPYIDKNVRRNGIMVNGEKIAFKKMK